MQAPEPITSRACSWINVLVPALAANDRYSSTLYRRSHSHSRCECSRGMLKVLVVPTDQEIRVADRR